MTTALKTLSCQLSLIDSVSKRSRAVFCVSDCKGRVTMDASSESTRRKVLEVVTGRVKGEEWALKALMSSEERAAYDAFVRKRFEPETSQATANPPSATVESNAGSELEAISAAVASVALPEDEDISPCDKFLCDWVNANYERAHTIKNTMLIEANKLIDAAKHVRNLSFKPSTVAFFNRIRNWDLVEWMYNFYVYHGFNFDHDISEVYTFSIHNCEDPSWEGLEWGSRQLIASYMRNFPELCLKFSDSKFCNPVWEPIAKICSRMEWIDLASYLKQAGLALDSEAPQMLACSIVVKMARIEMAESIIPWRDVDIDEVVAKLMDKKASNIRLGKGRRNLLGDPKKVNEMNKRRYRGQGTDMHDVAKALLSQTDEEVGKEYRRHAISCRIPKCHCLSF